MAKKSIIEREKKRRFLVKKFSTIRIYLRDKIKSSSSFEEKMFYSAQIQRLPRNSSSSRLHNRCLVTGRPKGYYRMFGLSRHIFRDMSHYGFLPGVTKSSW
uniref:Small ribosomal subunit protein uS14c n=1 Tax=Euglena anabaena TaxID=38273 RepID=A0A0G3F9I8_EUGAN|nr:ribosomal protein S14 [Euglenaria anabaena]AKJ83355.1 ribosomal protein S14 [Euglenaria anabaena]